MDQKTWSKIIRRAELARFGLRLVSYTEAAITVQGGTMNSSGGDSRQKVSRIVTQRLETLQRAGVSHLPKVGKTSGRAAAEPTTAAKSTVPTPVAATVERSLLDSDSSAKNIVPPEQRAAALAVIQQEVAACVRCPQLATTRTQTVFGVGNPNARICFFGEAPGADEDRQGEPFVGRGGQLLNKMISACQLKREEVYILNVLKCRPPENRNPLPEETANCRGYFERQLEIIRPEIVCCLGAVASQALLSTDRPIGKLRKQWHDYRGIAVICTYHPAYLLRNPSAKTDTWEDLKMMMRRIGVEL
jgi:uracil-DNA glycosylase